MARKKQNNLYKWVLIFVIAVALIIPFVVFKNFISTMTTISKEQATEKVKALPEVIEYLKRVPNGLILVNGEENDAYLIQVYEFKDEHTATFNWYSVNKNTGVVEKQF